MPLYNSRTACVQALQRWETSTVFADEVLHEALGSSQFNVFDRAFLTETFYGILRHRSALDFLIRQLRDTDLDLQTRQVLRLGFYQIFSMRIPPCSGGPSGKKRRSTNSSRRRRPRSAIPTPSSSSAVGNASSRRKEPRSFANGTILPLRFTSARTA